MPQIYRIPIYRNISSKVGVRAKWSLCGLPTGVTLWNVTNRQSWCRLAVSSLPASQLHHRLCTIQSSSFAPFTNCSPMFSQHGRPFFHFPFFYFPDNFFGKMIRSLDQYRLKLNILVFQTFGTHKNYVKILSSR